MHEEHGQTRQVVLSLEMFERDVQVPHLLLCPQDLTHSSACKLLGVDATSSCSPWLSHAHTRTRPGQGVLDEYLQGLIRETDFLSDARYVACLSSLSLRAWSMVLVCLVCVVNASMAYVMHAWLLGVCAHGRQPGRSRCQKPPLVPAPVGRRRVPQFQRAPLL